MVFYEALDMKLVLKLRDGFDNDTVQIIRVLEGHAPDHE